MKHKVKLTVIDKKLYPELQEQYCADPNSGMCPCYNVGDDFIFERKDNKDDFWLLESIEYKYLNADKNGGKGNWTPVWRMRISRPDH